MPEVRRFFYDSVLRGEYGSKLRVKFIPGAMPELVLYGADKQEVAREDISGLSFDQLHELVQAKGFTKVDPSALILQPALAPDEDVFGGSQQEQQEDDDYFNDAAGQDGAEVDEDEAEFVAELEGDDSQGGADSAESEYPDGEEEAAAEEAELARSAAEL